MSFWLYRAWNPHPDGEAGSVLLSNDLEICHSLTTFKTLIEIIVSGPANCAKISFPGLKAKWGGIKNEAWTSSGEESEDTWNTWSFIQFKAAHLSNATLFCMFPEVSPGCYKCRSVDASFLCTDESALLDGDSHPGSETIVWRRQPKFQHRSSRRAGSFFMLPLKPFII